MCEYKDNYGAVFNTAYAFLEKQHSITTVEAFMAVIDEMPWKDSDGTFEADVRDAVVWEMSEIYSLLPSE